MSKVRIFIYVAAGLLVVSGLIAVFTFNHKHSRDILLRYPFNKAEFPPEFPAPTFEWNAGMKDNVPWDLSLTTGNGKYEIKASVPGSSWKPEEQKWDSLKVISNHGKIWFTLQKEGKQGPYEKISFTISHDSVGAPILYRQMPIPFILAEKKLDSMNFMLINLGSKGRPHIAMRGFPVCGNCHSFSADGNTIGLDLDAGLRDKGGYFISPVRDTIMFTPQNYMSWSKIEKRRTFGLFSKISPDGRYVVTTVKDRVVMKNFPVLPVENMIFSQLFFPVNGHLAVYDRQENTLKELPGADSEEFVQSNATWTPDGKYIVFSRAVALPRDSNIYEINVQDEKLIDEFVKKKKTFKYDICIIPFNNGAGGKAVPVEGASGNGKSNFFPAVSPDGKWLVFCQAENFMLLMPDSRLFIVPVEGGKSRELASNLPSMNSWHAWSPNSRWIVYSSKGMNIYTDMFLTHIDKNGKESIPVLVEKARVPYKVINYPEFVNRDPSSVFSMKYDYIELAHIKMAVKNRDMEQAKQLFHKMESQNPFLFSEDCLELSDYLTKMGLKAEAGKYAEMAKHTINSNVFNSQQ
jgi:hypothetical protein